MWSCKRIGDTMAQDRDAAARDLASVIVERHVIRQWVHPGIVVLGAWLIVGPATMGVRNHAVLSSDAGAGALLVWFGFMFAPRHWWVPWATALVGVWLLFAPLVFRAPSATAYVNDTLVGTVVVMLAIVIPQDIHMKRNKLALRFALIVGLVVLLPFVFVLGFGGIGTMRGAGRVGGMLWTGDGWSLLYAFIAVASITAVLFALLRRRRT